MFRESLTEVCRIFSNNIDTDFTLDQWKEKLHIFLPLFGREINKLLEICQKEPLASISAFSKLEDVIWQPNGILIAEFRVRPKNNYYDELLKLVPQPENQQGPINTGIELSVGVYRGASRDKLVHPPHVTITFKIWGSHEREAFIAFYRDFRRPVEKLLSGFELALFTPCCFKNLEKHIGSDVINKLDLYLSNKIDPEDCFHVEKHFNKNADPDKVTLVFRNLLIIYHCCLGYCQKTPELDRFFNFISLYPFTLTNCRTLNE